MPLLLQIPNSLVPWQVFRLDAAIILELNELVIPPRSHSPLPWTADSSVSPRRQVRLRLQLVCGTCKRHPNQRQIILLQPRLESRVSRRGQSVSKKRAKLHSLPSHPIRSEPSQANRVGRGPFDKRIRASSYQRPIESHMILSCKCVALLAKINLVWCLAPA